MINESMARRFFGEPHRAIGQRLRTRGAREAFKTIVGVAGNVFQFDHSRPQGLFAAYYPRQQPSLSGQQKLILRTARAARPPADAIRQQIWSIDPSQAIHEIATADDMYYEFFATPRFHALLMTVFAAIGVCMAAVGLYGVLAYAVVQRTREFGIRFALGARRADIMRLSLGQGARVTAAGLVLGAVGSLIVTRGLESMLVGLSRTDPVTYAMTLLVLIAVASLANWIPSRRRGGSGTRRGAQAGIETRKGDNSQLPIPPLKDGLRLLWVWEWNVEVPDGSARACGTCMSAARIAGIVLIVIGLIGLLWGGISWTEERTVVDLGPIEARAQERETIPVPPIVGGIALVAGIVLLVIPSRRRV